jgi:hypothetical protein
VTVDGWEPPEGGIAELDHYPVEVDTTDGKHLTGELHVAGEVVTLEPCDGLAGSVEERIGLPLRKVLSLRIRRAEASA